MKRLIFIKYLLMSLLCTCLSSCLTAGLDDDLPVYTEAEVTAFNFEYRWAIQEGISEKMQVKTLTTKTLINNEEGSSNAPLQCLKLPEHLRTRFGIRFLYPTL